MRSAILAVLAAAASLAAAAQGAPSDATLRGFQPSSDYILVVNGNPVPAAEIYKNEQVPAILILTSALPSPVLLTPRSGSVETVNLMKVAKQKDGTVDLLADAVLSPVGPFQLEGASSNPTFTYQGKKVSLTPRPALRGLRKGSELLANIPEYVRNSNGYRPNAAAIAALKGDRKPVTVHVVFGSWCPHCRQLVPLMLRVENEVKNPNIKFEYYGIDFAPDGWKDPEVKRLGVKGIPTAIIYVNGVQAGRIEGATDWDAPEVALSKMINGATGKGK
ncbi:MAG TPA: thioredoxin family protein [Thermoanaerobaculia bacterium]